MLQYLRQHRVFISGFLSGLVGVLVISWLVTESRLANLRQQLDADLSLSLAAINELATYQERNLPNSFTQRFVPTCPSDSQGQYDGLLSRLDEGLSQVELRQLIGLFLSCGYVSIQQARHLHEQLRLELMSYDKLVTIRQQLRLSDGLQSQRQAWHRYLSLLERRIDTHEDLVRTQESIVHALAEGMNIESEAIGQFLSIANNRRQELTSIRQEMGQLRPLLSSP